MLRPETYKQLYQALKAKNYRLITDPEAYRLAHHLPEAYPTIAEYSVPSVWRRGQSLAELEPLADLLAPFGDRPVVIKDFVKSEKHAWHEACFIPRASDTVQARSVIETFLELRGSQLNEGLVVREFVSFKSVGRHPLSDMPLSQEFRSFVVAGRVVATAATWPDARYDGQEPAAECLKALAGVIESPFFSMDWAQREDGGWCVIEIGDGQVSSLPEAVNRVEFFRALAKNLIFPDSSGP